MSACWEWPRVNNRGYGYVWLNATERMSAHRLVYEEAIGSIPPGWVVHHICGNRRCVNPEHLTAMPRGDHSRLHALLDDTCAHGHPRTPENVYVTPNGERRCRSCNARNARAYKRRSRR